MKNMEIRCVDDLLMIEDMTANYRLTADIDLNGYRWQPIGSENVPFTGTFCGNGHTISHINVAAENETCVGFFGVNDGIVTSLTLEDVRVGAMFLEDGCMGAVAGVNRGKIADVSVAGGFLQADVLCGKIKLGGIIGYNRGTVHNTSSNEFVTLHTCGGSACAGGLVGASDGGVLETLEYSGEMTCVGEQILAGMFAGRLDGTMIRACRFSAPFNSLNGEVFTNLTGEEHGVNRDGNLWRDNRGDDRLLSKEQIAVRQKAVRHMRRMATVEWTPDRTMVMDPCSCGGKVHVQVFPAGQTQYGLPYTHYAGSFERFMHCFDENGNLKPFVRTQGFNGFDLYIGNDCSTAVYWAWNKVSDDIDFTLTGGMRPYCGHGTLPIGEYVYPEGQDSAEIIETNGYNTIAECYTKLHAGDAVLASAPGNGHVRMVTGTPVVYRHEDGDLDLLQSYVVTTEQGNGLLHEPKVQKSRSWLVDYHYSFLNLLKTSYIPITIAAIRDGKVAEPQVSYDSDATGMERLFCGKVSSNYRIMSVTVALTAENGETCFEKKIFTAVYGTLDGEERGDEILLSRQTIKVFDMIKFSIHRSQMRLHTGQIYSACIRVMLGNGEEYTVDRFDIQA